MKSRILAPLKWISTLLVFIFVALGADRACGLLGIEGSIVQIVAIGFVLYMTSMGNKQRKENNVALLRELFSKYGIGNNEQNFTVLHAIVHDFERRQE